MVTSAFRPKLRARLLGFFALTLVVPVLLISAVVLSRARRSLMDAIYREQREVARRIGDRVSSHVEHVQSVLLNVASQETFLRSRPAQQYPVLRQIMESYPDLLECSVVDRRGKESVKAVRRGEAIATSNILVNRSNRDEFRVADLGKAYVGPVFFTQRDRVPQIFLSVPLGRSEGVLLARLSLDGLWKLVSEGAVGRTGYAYVVDAKGNLLAHPQTDRVLSHENLAGRSVVQEFMRGESEHLGTKDGSPHTHEGDGDEMTLAVHHTVPDLGWGVVVQSPLKEAMAPVREMMRRGAAAAFILGAIFLAIGVSLIKKILEPLHRLQGGVQQLAKGDLKHRLDIRTGDEIQSLAEEFNRMAESLSVSEQAKRDLSHMIVHDLKGPLSGVLGCLDYLASGSIGELTPEQKKILSLGGKSGKDLLRLIQSLLDTAKMEEGRLELKREPFSVAELAAECVDDLEAIAKRERKTIHLDVPSGLPLLHADRDLLHRVLFNLLSNAIKHTSPDGDIWIQASSRLARNTVVLSVRDNGEGIPAEFLERIFGKFEQAVARHSKVRMGSGLGLTFCKLAVEAHGGKIWVESEMGKGCEFFVEIPLPAPEPIIMSPAETAAIAR